MTMRPDPTFYASPKLAMEAPPENFAYTLLLSPDFSKPDALAVIDVKKGSPTYSKIVHTVTMPNKGDEFHHFGWNACSSALSPLTGHAFIERRYLIIPGLRSSRIYIIDTKPDPTQAKIHKIIEPEEVFKKTGYSRPHTIHCGPEGIYVSTLGGGGKDGTEGPPGVFIMDCETFEVLGRWELDRGPQTRHYDFWWNLPRDYMVTSEWALPPQFENGIVPEDLLSNRYGPLPSFLGSARAAQRPDHRSRREPSDGPGSASRARSRAGVRLCRRRRRHHQPRGIDLDLVARRGEVPR
jgi:selenium-binding protein 1